MAEASALFVVLPNINIWNADAPGPGSGRTFLRTAGRQRGVSAAARPATDLAGCVLDRVAPNDTLLMMLDHAQRLALLRDYPGLRIVPVARLAPQWLRQREVISPRAVQPGKRQSLAVTVVDAVSGNPLAGVDVIGFVSHAQRTGSLAMSNARGVAHLHFPAGISTLELVQAVPASAYWPVYVREVALAAGRLTLACQPIDLAVPDVRHHFGLEGADEDGKGVRVGVVDTGVSRHPDLRVQRRRNVVKGELPSDADDEIGHGTHVAGIIAGRGRPRRGMRGAAPAAGLYAYRVFGRGEDTATSFNIAKAIRQAVSDGCDLINLSLGGASPVPEVEREILRARAMGVVCLAASGNEYRAEVGYPGRYSAVLAISASGRKGTWPSGAAQDLSVARPYGDDRKNFVADFSNVGSEIALTGPGVGVVSTYPGGYAVMDGTSMACPAATGALARLLSRNPALLRAQRNQARSDAIVKLALQSAKPLGFGALYEGAGMLFVAR